MRAVQLPLQGHLTGTTVGQKQKLRRKPQHHCTHLSAGNCAGCFCHSPSKPCKKQKTLLSLLLIPVILILYFDTAYFGVVSFCYARSFSRNYLGLDGRCILLTTKRFYLNNVWGGDFLTRKFKNFLKFCDFYVFNK